MKSSLLITLFFPIVFLLGCGKSSQYDTPDSLAQAYVQFLNNGAKLEDFKTLLADAEEYSSLLSQPSGLTKEQAKALGERYENTLKFLDEWWIKQDFTKRLDLRPYTYISLSTEKRDADKACAFNRLKAADKNGKVHSFRLRSLVKVDNSWKIVIADDDDYEDITNPRM